MLALGLGLASCKKDVQSRNPIVKPGQVKPAGEKEGTVDGGGGNIVCDDNGKNCSILDLVEDKDREPYLFDMLTLARAQFPDDFQSYSKHLTAMVIFGGNPDLKFVFGSNADFMTWILSQRLMTNQEASWGSRPFEDVYGDEAFGLDSKNLKNLRYYFTDKDLPLLKDQGHLKFTNPAGIKQLALQDFDGNVLIQRQEFEKLDLRSKYALKLHESMLYLLLRLNNNHLKVHGTSKIREFVRTFIKLGYDSTIEGRKLIDITDVKKAFDALEIPLLNAKYETIGSISDRSQDASRTCELSPEIWKNIDGSERRTPNYFFKKGETKISDSFAMDSTYYMKVQIYLVNRGMCIFKPAPCEIKMHRDEKEPTEMHGWTIFRNQIPLPDVSQEFKYAQEVVLKNYQFARICE